MNRTLHSPTTAALLTVTLAVVLALTQPVGTGGQDQLDASGPVPTLERYGTTATRFVPRGLDLYMPVPPDNPMTREMVALGRRLFFERRVSDDGSMSCASCHDPNRAFAGSARVAIGIGRRQGSRNVPTLVNRGYGRSFFWDGRAATLEDQVLQPISNRAELGSSLDEVLERLGSDRSYRAAFEDAFGQAPTSRHLACALATYVRTVCRATTRSIGR
jgi:cytochrome c peroxidase